jgi:hypothetical protein
LLKAEGRFAALPVAASRGVKLGGTVATVGFSNIGLQRIINHETHELHENCKADSVLCSFRVFGVGRGLQYGDVRGTSRCGGAGVLWWGEATDEPVRADARPTEVDGGVGEDVMRDGVHRTASNMATMFAGGTSAMMLWTCWKT